MAGLGWAVCLFALEFDFGILGTAGGFCFLLLLFGWAGLGCRWAWPGSPHARLRKFETNGNAIRSETHTISIYPALEGLGFRV